MPAHSEHVEVAFEPVAFAQNQREEVRELGDAAMTLGGQGTHQTTYVAAEGPIGFGVLGGAAHTVNAQRGHYDPDTDTHVVDPAPEGFSASGRGWWNPGVGPIHAVVEPPESARALTAERGQRNNGTEQNYVVGDAEPVINPALTRSFSKQLGHSGLDDLRVRRLRRAEPAGRRRRPDPARGRPGAGRRIRDRQHARGPGARDGRLADRRGHGQERDAERHWLPEPTCPWCPHARERHEEHGKCVEVVADEFGEPTLCGCLWSPSLPSPAPRDYPPAADDHVDPLLPPRLDSARYKALGNAVCVPVAEWVGRRVRWVALGMPEGEQPREAEPEGLQDAPGAARAWSLHPDALGRSGEALTPSPDAEGRVRLRPPGLGVAEDESFTLTAAGQPPGVATSWDDPDRQAPTIRAGGHGRPGIGRDGDEAQLVPVLDAVDAGDDDSDDSLVDAAVLG